MARAVRPTSAGRVPSSRSRQDLERGEVDAAGAVARPTAEQLIVNLLEPSIDALQRVVVV